jgi:hypothetical protein
VFGPDLDIRVIQTLLGNKDYNFDPEDLQLGREFNADFEKESIQSQIAYLDKSWSNTLRISKPNCALN